MSKELHPVTFWDRGRLPENMKDYRLKAEALVETEAAPVAAPVLGDDDLAGSATAAGPPPEQRVTEPVTPPAHSGAAPD